jgi:hypothetical protein
VEIAQALAQQLTKQMARGHRELTLEGEASRHGRECQGISWYTTIDRLMMLDYVLFMVNDDH